MSCAPKVWATIPPSVIIILVPLGVSVIVTLNADSTSSPQHRKLSRLFPIAFREPGQVANVMRVYLVWQCCGCIFARVE